MDQIDDSLGWLKALEDYLSQKAVAASLAGKPLQNFESLLIKEMKIII
jgi:hypothetical protein